MSAPTVVIGALVDCEDHRRRPRPLQKRRGAAETHRQALDGLAERDWATLRRRADRRLPRGGDPPPCSGQGEQPSGRTALPPRGAARRRRAHPRPPAMLPAKAFVRDREDVLVGTCNLDAWSLKRFFEIDVLVRSRALAAQLDERFLAPAEAAQRPGGRPPTRWRGSSRRRLAASSRRSDGARRRWAMARSRPGAAGPGAGAPGRGGRSARFSRARAGRSRCSRAGRGLKGSCHGRD